MNVKKASFTDEQRKEIQGALKRPQTPHVYKRLMALKLKAVDGLRSDETGAYVGLHKSSVNLIVRRVSGTRHSSDYREASQSWESIYE